MSPNKLKFIALPIIATLIGAAYLQYSLKYQVNEYNRILDTKTTSNPQIFKQKLDVFLNKEVNHASTRQL